MSIIIRSGNGGVTHIGASPAVGRGWAARPTVIVRPEPAIERNVALPIYAATGSVHVTGGGTQTVGGYKSSQQARTRRRVGLTLPTKRQVIVPVRESCAFVGGAVAAFANPADGRLSVIGAAIGWAVGWAWEGFGPGPD